MQPSYNTLYNYIEALCRTERINITILCRELGITRSVLSELKAGRTRMLSAETLERIAVRFSITIGTLMRAAGISAGAPPIASESVISSPMRAFAAELESLCMTWEESPAHLAEATGIPLFHVQQLRGGSKLPTPEDLATLTAYFGVPPRFFDAALSTPLQEPEPSNVIPLTMTATRRIPVLGSVPAGVPIEAVPDIVGHIDLPADRSVACFALKVRGDSMLPEYHNDDVVVVQTDIPPRTGDDVVAYVSGGEATLKRLRLTDSDISLLPLNPAFQPMIFTVEQAESLPLTFAGVVTELRRRRRSDGV